MTVYDRRGPAWRSATQVWSAALILFVITIVIGILNGLDIYDPPRDTLLTHVHAGTLGWITLAVFGAALLAFTRGQSPGAAETRGVNRMAWAMIIGIALYVAAFWLGDSIGGNRIQRPIVGTLLFIIIVWTLVWMIRQIRGGSTVPKMALLLSWVSLFVGAILGVLLGVFSSQGSIPGLSDETAASLAFAHPPAMIIGFLILAGLGIAEWTLRDEEITGRNRTWGMAAVWVLFAAGMLVNVAFIARMEDQLLGPANMLQFVAIIIFVVRLWPELRLSSWAGSGALGFPRLTTLFLVVNLFLFAYLISQLVSGNFNIDNPTPQNLGLLLSLDHFMFIGVATNALFGAIALGLKGRSLDFGDRLVIWGVNLGLLGFALGLITVTPWLKRVSTPVMGLALLWGIYAYVKDLSAADGPAPAGA
ncbi:MAG: hypothetical protein ACE5F5_03265 [Acidimicrobiia bacterium]